MEALRKNLLQKIPHTVSTKRIVNNISMSIYQDCHLIEVTVKWISRGEK